MRHAIIICLTLDYELSWWSASWGCGCSTSPLQIVSFVHWIHCQSYNYRIALASTKIWGWAVTRRRCLNIPWQGPAPDAKLSAMEQNWLVSSVRTCFVEASSTVEKAVSCYKTDWLVALLLSFHNVQSSLGVREFVVQGKNAANEATERYVRTFDAWCCGAQTHQNNRSYMCMWAQRTYLWII